MRPLIGIETDLVPSPKGPFTKLYVRYSRLVLRAGGFPLLLPCLDDPGYLDELISRMDGLLLTGGDDLPPPSGSAPNVVPVLPERLEHARSLVRLALSRQLPTLGICFGMQLMGECLGGEIVYDIPSERAEALEHRGSGGGHPIRVEAGSRLAGLLGCAGEMRVNSYHHQAISRVHPPLLASAKSPDGLVEAFEHREHPLFLGLQWHPELEPDSAISRRLFSGLIQAAQAKRREP